MLNPCPTSLVGRFVTCRRIRGRYRLVVLALSAMLTVSCATLDKPGDSAGMSGNENDPFENFNRGVWGFNEKLDKVALKPLARGYSKAIPRPMRNRVTNFFGNLGEPKTIVNNLLQGKVGLAYQDAWRFLINTTIGVVGLFDVAGRAGLVKHNEDFGQTLAVWGVKDGPYLVLPLFGPSNVRDGIGRIPDAYLNPINQIDDSSARIVLRALSVIDARARLLRVSRILAMQLDPYLFLRESYRQQRRQLIYDGAYDGALEPGIE